MVRIVLNTLLLFCLLGAGAVAAGLHPHAMGALKPVDSVLKVKVGDPAPDFDLPAIGGGRVRLSDYRGKKNVVLSFVPAAWTPVCSDQWPGYNLAVEMIEQYNGVLLGISVDNTPTQCAWVEAMGGLDFPVLSDFWPHGGTADRYGILRSDGMTERALFIIDTRGIVRFALVNDINKRPDLGALMHALAEVAATP